MRINNLIDLAPGDIVIISPAGLSGFTATDEMLGALISIKQSYWDFGEGDCGYVNVAEVLVGNKIVDVVCSHLELFR